MNASNAGATPVYGAVRCLSPAGLHTMRYAQWGDPRNERVLVCVHGLTRTGRDFDHLARALLDEFRVVCPDVAGRGRSDWLRDPNQYQVSQYVADMVTLIARLDVDKVAWVGTSMGGLIGLCLAGLEDSPIGRLVLNDVGPHLEAAALLRIGSYVGKDQHFASLDEAVAYNKSIAAGFGMRNDEEWHEITASVLKRTGNGFAFHYDPAIAVPMRSMTQESMAGAEQLLWHLYDAIACPTLVVRGAVSDLLTEETVAQMCQRGPRPEVLRVPGVGHAPMFFDPAQIAPVRDFLRAPA